MTVLERSDSFLNSLTSDDRVAVIHDTDPDGVCSAVIISKAVERLTGNKIVLRMSLNKQVYGITDEMLEKIKAANVNILITTDFSPDQDPERLHQIPLKILIIDHHKLYEDVNDDRIVMVKPQLFTDVEPSRYCTAKLAFDLSSRVVDVSDLDWCAAVASIADIATEPWKDFIDDVFKKYNIEKADDLFKTGLGDAAATVSSTEVYDVNLVGKAFDVVYAASSAKDVVNSELSKYRDEIDGEIDRWISCFPADAEKHGELYIFEVKPRYHVQSVISTILGLKYKNNTIIIIDTSAEFIRASARRNDRKIAVNKLLEDAVEGFEDSNAGGHVPAAGAGFHSKDLAKFKERVVALAGK